MDAMAGGALETPMFLTFSYEELQQVYYPSLQSFLEGPAVEEHPRFAVVDRDGFRRQSQPPAPPKPISVEAAIDGYLKHKELSPGTRAEYRTLRNKWHEWLENPRSIRPRVIGEVTAEEVAGFLDWLHEQAKVTGKNPGRTFNKHRAELLAVFHWCVRRGDLDHLVRWPEKRTQRTVAGQYFLTPKEMSSVYWATYKLRKNCRWADTRPMDLLWRAALTIFYTYGLDTYALFYQKGKDQICWGHVFDTKLPPGRVANVRCPYGWIRWERQKTGRLLLLPIHPIVKAHLDAIRPSVCRPEDPIFARAGGGKPNDVFRRLCIAAGLPAKVDHVTGEIKPWVLKDLRKTCATAHGKASGRLILGHSDGSITEIHYANQLPEVLQAIRKLKYPRAMRSILDESIKPPEMLFAK